MKKTIIVVSAHTGKWGAERSTCSLSAYLQSKGYNVLVIIPEDGEIVGLLKDYNLQYHVCFFRLRTYIGNKNPLRWLKISITNFLQLINLVLYFKRKNIRPDIVYSNTLVHSFGIKLSKWYRIPHIQHIRENIDAFGMNFYHGYRNTMKYISKNSSYVICTCGEVMKRYQNDIPKEKLTYVYNGIPVQDIVLKSEPNEGILKMIYIGRLDPDKRPQDLCAAIKILKEDGYDKIRLDIYGTGSMEAELIQFINKMDLSDIVEFKGFCALKEINCSAYDIGVLTSTFEAFARTTLEYMMNGLAVIGSESGGTKEQVVNGKTGLLFEPHNIDSLANAIKKLYIDRDLCLKMGYNGRERFVKNFSQDRYLEGVFSYFQKVLG